jgi:ketosteroid isomerase-like protein
LGAPADSLTIDEARRIFDRRVQAWLAEDVDAYLDCWHDDLELWIPGRDEPVRGRAEYRELVEGSNRWAAPKRFVVHHLAVDGAVVLAEWTIAATRRSDGVEVEWDGMSACLVDAGRIRWWREHHRTRPALVDSADPA